MKRAKAWQYRHQATGIINSPVMFVEPSQEQLDAKWAELSLEKGTHHKKTGEKLWIKAVPTVVEMDDKAFAALGCVEADPDPVPLPSMDDLLAKLEATTDVTEVKAISAQIRERHAASKRSPVEAAPFIDAVVSGAGTVTNPEGT